MASPQLENGYTRTANELSEAIMQSNFSKRQYNIVELIIRMSYGCGKKSALLRYSDFELVGVSKVDIKSELTYLVSVRVIEIENIPESQMMRIYLNKNYDQWRINIVKGFNAEKWEKVLKRNLDDKVSETLTNFTDQVSNLLTEQSQTVSNLLTSTLEKCNNDNGLEAPKEIDLKEIDLKETTTTEQSNQRDMKEVADVVDIGSEARELEKLRARILGNLFPTGEDLKVMDKMLEIMPFTKLKPIIETAYKAYKPKFKGDKIRTLSYFLPIVQQMAATIESRAAPDKKETNVEQSQESQELTDELMNLIPEWMAKEAMNGG